MGRRVVITGMGVIVPGGKGIKEFYTTMINGKSPISFIPVLKALNFGCQIGGMVSSEASPYLEKLSHLGFAEANEFVKLSCIAAMEAWENAGFKVPEYQSGDADYETGIIMGSGIGAVDIVADKLIPFTNNGMVKKMRSTIVEYSMFSASTANVAGLLSLGNQVLSVSSACASSTDAIIMGYDRIKSGKAQRMLAGGVEVCTPYSWSGFDAMRLLTRDFNDSPDKGSCPMSENASGFVPSSGAGVLVLEELQSALDRGAKIYAEVRGGHSNSGGQRNGGSMTIPNPEGVIYCIQKALDVSQTLPHEIDLISGHLTSTIGDVHEVNNWKKALKTDNHHFPFINAPKSIFGHTIGAAGAIETIAAALQISNDVIHPSINCEKVKNEIAALIDTSVIPQKAIKKQINCIAKASFGFGDVNACLILKKY